MASLGATLLPCTAVVAAPLPAAGTRCRSDPGMYKALAQNKVLMQKLLYKSKLQALRWRPWAALGPAVGLAAHVVGVTCMVCDPFLVLPAVSEEVSHCWAS